MIDASCRRKDFAARLAVVCFVPAPGHVIPLLKIAAQVRHISDILVVVPDELVDLVKDSGFEAVGVGPVRPESGQLEVQRYIAASELTRIASAHAATVSSYLEPLKAGIARSMPRHRAVLRQYAPTCILSDNHGWVSGEAKTLLKGMNVPVFLHLPAAFFGKHHNTWSLHHCYWSDYKTAVRDAVRKTRNELLLLAKRWGATHKRIFRPIELDQLPPLRAPKKRFVSLATGTSFLEAGLLTEHLLYTGADHLVLPTMPPLELPLPQELGDWLDESPDGECVYISFGTLVRPDVATAARIVRAALTNGKRVLLQYPGDFPAMPAVRREQWVPQAKVLSHPAVSLFITHGGAGSVEEALWYGKPMLCIPRVWDHYYTSWIVSLLGAGTSVSRRSLRSRRRLNAGVQRALMPEYAGHAKSISEMMRKHWSKNQTAVAGLFVAPTKASQAH